MIARSECLRREVTQSKKCFFAQFYVCGRFLQVKSTLWADLRCPQFAFLRWSHFQERTPYIWICELKGLKLRVRNFQVVARTGSTVRVDRPHAWSFTVEKVSYVTVSAIETFRDRQTTNTNMCGWVVFLHVDSRFRDGHTDKTNTNTTSSAGWILQHRGHSGSRGHSAVLYVCAGSQP